MMTDKNGVREDAGARGMLVFSDKRGFTTVLTASGLTLDGGAQTGRELQAPSLPSLSLGRRGGRCQDLDTLTIGANYPSVELYFMIC